MYKMKKAIITTLMVTTLLGTCSCAMSRDAKLYTEDEFLTALKQKYDADFKIVNSNQIEKNEIVYTVIVEGDPDTEFEVKNYLKASTEIGPKVNRIESDALMYYFISDYAYEGYMLYQSGELDSSYYVMPKLTESDSYDGKYTVGLTAKDKEVQVTVVSGDDEVFTFPAGKEAEFRGVCWDKNNYDLWLQYQDGKLVCYRMTDETWKVDDAAEKPDYIVYNIHPTWK